MYNGKSFSRANSYSCQSKKENHKIFSPEPLKVKKNVMRVTSNLQFDVHSNIFQNLRENHDVYIFNNHLNVISANSSVSDEYE